MMLSRATDAARKALTQRRYASSDNLLKTMLYVRPPASGKGFTRAAIVAATRRRAHTTRKRTAVAAPIAARFICTRLAKTHDRSHAARAKRP